VCLLMTNQPEYLAIWLGITSVGGVVALLNTNLVGPSLSRCINIVSPKHAIVAEEFADALTTALPGGAHYRLGSGFTASTMVHTRVSISTSTNDPEKR
jgi:acyl-CoA synthetase (AMP-forming)/AMP-acid ligase II